MSGDASVGSLAAGIRLISRGGVEHAPRKYRSLSTGRTGCTRRARVVTGRVLVVLGFDVHRPHVVVGSEDVLDGQHRREHRMILVVVLVHAVAAARKDV